MSIFSETVIAIIKRERGIDTGYQNRIPPRKLTIYADEKKLVYGDTLYMLPKEKLKLTVEVEPEYATYYNASWFCEFGDEFIELSEHPNNIFSSPNKHNTKTIKAIKTGSSRIFVKIGNIVVFIDITVTDRIPGIKDYINYHTFDPYSQRKPTSETVVIANNADKMNGCTFDGWSTQRNSKSIAYKPGDEYNGDKSLELYPVWERIKFTLTYDANGGNNAPNAQTIEYDIMSNLSDVTPDRKGYVFLGWSENKSPQSAVFQPKGEFAARRDVILYAMWEEEKNQKILIDAGHDIGFNTIYFANSSYSEGDRMWDFQEILIKELRNAGFVNTERLRTSNVNLFKINDGGSWKDWNIREHKARGKKAAGYDLFIQLHTNAAFVEKLPKNENGIEISVSNSTDYLMLVQAENDQNHTLFANDLAKEIKTVMEIKGNSIFKTGDYTAILSAYASGCPLCFLVENSFHTNEDVTKWLNDDKNLYELAKAYVEVIKTHLI